MNRDEPRPVFDELVDRDAIAQAADDEYARWSLLIERTMRAEDPTAGAVCWMPDEHEGVF